RCLEVVFRALRPDEVARIAKHAAEKAEFAIDEGALDVIRRYAANGREAVNMVQLAGGTALAAGRRRIFREDVEWVVSSGQYSPRPEPKVPDEPQVGAVNGLAVFGPNLGAVIEVEATAIPTRPGEGKLVITGVMEEEEMGGSGVTMRRRSMARSSVDNVLTVLRRSLGLSPQDYDIHVNFPGAVPVDGPSAGAAMVTAIYSAITGIPVKARCAMTGEVSIRGAVRPVGGIVPKLEAAKEAGVDLVFIPEDNWQQRFAAEKGMAVRPVRRIHQVVKEALVELPRAASLRRALEAEEAGVAEEGGRAEPCPVTV
ncbi:MAG: ATP-dependent protease LonB, partial [Clostridia bacterium]